MHLLQRMKAWRELRRLEPLAASRPCPETFCALGRLYLDLGLYDKAVDLAEAGVEQFSRSIELRGLLGDARQGQLAIRVEALRAELTRSPNPAVFAALADAHAESEDFDALRELCRGWRAQSPDDAGSWLALGQAHLAIFCRCFTANDGHDALECLSRAVDLAPDAPTPRRLLGEHLYRIGAVSDALCHLHVLRELTPDDEDLAQLLGYVSELPRDSGDVDALLRAVERRGSWIHPGSVEERRHEACPVAAAQACLSALVARDGVIKATLIRGSKAAVSGVIAGGRDPFLKLVRASAKAAHGFARRLGMGRAAKTTLEGEFGRVCICVYGDALAAAQVRSGADVAGVLEALQDLVLDAAGEEVAAS